jgi:hypothetical protein
MQTAESVREDVKPGLYAVVKETERDLRKMTLVRP